MGVLIENKTNTAQLELELGLSLAKMIPPVMRNYPKFNINMHRKDFNTGFENNCFESDLFQYKRFKK